jgi:hypothetical protein
VTLRSRYAFIAVNAPVLFWAWPNGTAHGL